MQDKALIQIKFSKTSPEGLEYQDAIYYTSEEYAALKEEDLEAAKQARFDAWLNTIQNPVSAPEPTEEQIIEERVKVVKEALAKDEPVINGILDATLVVAPTVSNREELRSALLKLSI